MSNEMEQKHLIDQIQENFRQMQLRWQKYCPDVDQVLEELGSKHNWEIEKWNGDSLTRVVYWKSQETEHSIIMYLDDRDTNPHLEIWAASWQNDEKLLRQYSVQFKPVVVTVPVKAKLFRPLINRLTRLLENDFEKQGLSVESDLQPYPGNF